MSERLITVAIHTLRYACSLKNMLEKENIKVTLQNVNLSEPEISAGVRVRIPEKDLPLALRIIENPEIFSDTMGTDENAAHHILVPIDFSTYSRQAAIVAFHLAHRHNVSLKFLYSFVDPIYSKRSQLNDTLDFDPDAKHNEATIKEFSDSEKRMNEFESELIELIKKGDIPPVKFSHSIEEGVPEDVINQYAREHFPMLIVMGTREAGAKERDLVGSVTAEVLDTCRFPILTIPDNMSKVSKQCSSLNIIFFSNFDQQDILAVDTMLKLLPYKNLNINFIKLPSKKFTGDTSTALNRLRDYCKAHYAGHDFTTANIHIDSIEEEIHEIVNGNQIDLIAVPNKKKNVFARFFNPGVAHRILFHSDIPMMVIPV